MACSIATADVQFLYIHQMATKLRFQKTIPTLHPLEKLAVSRYTFVMRHLIQRIH